MRFFALCLALTGAMTLGCDSGEDTEADAGGGGGEVPAEYVDLTNPVDGDVAATTAGKALYDAVCATCHNANGDGMGPTGSTLDPAPTAFNVDQSGSTDGYLYWRIDKGTEGGPSGSSMPAYGGTYDEAQIWQLVTYIRSLGT